jgi:hypothetical protein
MPAHGCFLLSEAMQCMGQVMLIWLISSIADIDDNEYNFYQRGPEICSFEECILCFALLCNSKEATKNCSFILSEVAI